MLCGVTIYRECRLVETCASSQCCLLLHGSLHHSALVNTRIPSNRKGQGVSRMRRHRVRNVSGERVQFLSVHDFIWGSAHCSDSISVLDGLEDACLVVLGVVFVLVEEGHEDLCVFADFVADFVEEVVLQDEFVHASELLLEAALLVELHHILPALSFFVESQQNLRHQVEVVLHHHVRLFILLALVLLWQEGHVLRLNSLRVNHHINDFGEFVREEGEINAEVGVGAEVLGHAFGELLGSQNPALDEVGEVGTEVSLELFEFGVEDFIQQLVEEVFAPLLVVLLGDGVDGEVLFEPLGRRGFSTLLHFSLAVVGVEVLYQFLRDVVVLRHIPHFLNGLQLLRGLVEHLRVTLLHVHR